MMLVLLLMFFVVVAEGVAIIFFKYSFFDKNMPAVFRLVGKLCIGLKQCVMIAVDVQMVSICGCNYCKIGVQLQERAIILVGLNHNILAIVVYQQVAAQILAYATEKCAATARSVV